MRELVREEMCGAYDLDPPLAVDVGGRARAPSASPSRTLAALPSRSRRISPPLADTAVPGMFGGSHPNELRTGPRRKCEFRGLARLFGLGFDRPT